MKLYFYCILKDISEPNFSLRGVDNQKIFFIHNKNLYAAVSATSTMQYKNTHYNRETHEKIIKAFMKKYSILPFKFNSIVGEKLGRGIIVKYYNELQKNLSRIQNKVEFLVKAIKKVNDNINIPIKRKLMRKAKRSSLSNKILDIKTKVLANQINNKFETIASESHVEMLLNDKTILNGEYLVDKRLIGRFNKAFSDLRALYPQLEFFSIGPRPPYCFNLIDITKDNTVKLKKLF